MSLDQAFLRDILANPDDDAPRLVFANWLEEHAQPERAEFIRLQCEQARGQSTPARLTELAQRTHALLKGNRAAWQKEAPAWGRRGVQFSRGFIAHVQCTALDFLKGAAGLFRRAPIQSIHFRTYSERMEELAGRPFLTRLTALSFCGNYGDRLDTAGARRLARSPHLGNVRELDLGVCSIGPEGMKALAGSPYRARVARMVLNGNEIGLAGARALANSPHLAGLTLLNLGYNHVADKGAEALADSLHLGQMRDLYVWTNDLTARGARALAEAPWQLAGLSLARNAIGDEGACRLANAANLASLKTLFLAETGLTESGARALAGARHLTGLTELDLKDNEIGNAGAIALAESPHLASLKRLNLDNNDVGDEGAKALADSPHLGQLEYLRLLSHSLGKSAVAHLEKRFGPQGVVAFGR